VQYSLVNGTASLSTTTLGMATKAAGMASTAATAGGTIVDLGVRNYCMQRANSDLGDPTSLPLPGIE